MVVQGGTHSFIYFSLLNIPYPRIWQQSFLVLLDRGMGICVPVCTLNMQCTVHGVNVYV